MTAPLTADRAPRAADRAPRAADGEEYEPVALLRTKVIRDPGGEIHDVDALRRRALRDPKFDAIGDRASAADEQTTRELTATRAFSSGTRVGGPA